MFLLAISGRHATYRNPQKAAAAINALSPPPPLPVSCLYIVVSMVRQMVAVTIDTQIVQRSCAEWCKLSVSQPLGS